MDDSIVLISSDESNGPHSPVRKTEIKSDIESDETVDYLPPVNFEENDDLETDLQNGDAEPSNFPSVTTFPKNKFHSLSESEEHYEVPVNFEENNDLEIDLQNGDTELSNFPSVPTFPKNKFHSLSESEEHYEVPVNFEENNDLEIDICDVDTELPTVPRVQISSKNEVHSISESEKYYLPPVNFEVNGNLGIENQNFDTKPSTFASVTTFPKKKCHALSESEESDCEMVVNFEKGQNGTEQRKSSSQHSSDDISEGTSKTTRKKKTTNADTKEEKARKKAEAMEMRAKRRAEQAKEKAAKKLAAQVHRSMKPGECIKHMQVVLDSRLLSAEFGGELLIGLQGAEIEYIIKDQDVPFSITWIRKVLQPQVAHDLKVEMLTRQEEETEAVLVCQCLEALHLVHDNKLTRHISTIQQRLTGKHLTLVIYGAEQYFRVQKTNKRREVRGQVLGSTEGTSKSSKADKRFESAPNVTKADWEMALAELQLFADCNCRLIDQPQAMGLFIKQFTKAVAERPFKLQKQSREQEQLHWFAAGDSRDCVRVDKDGNGIHRLWQQQLSQFGRVGMEVSEAIASVYRTPRLLVQVGLMEDRIGFPKEMGKVV